MNIVILGGGESGYGSAYLAKSKGFRVFVSDKGTIKEKYRRLLEENGIDYEEGSHSEERILAADRVIKSPGIPKKEEIIQKIKQKGIRLSSEIEFASEFTDAKIIAITGSNGKTTTTSLIYHILKKSGLSVGLGGNIGVSFARQVADDKFDYYVLEISSFQLDDIQKFRPYISLLLNLSPDHLDQYNYSYDDYISAKFRITENQQCEDFFIFNNDDETTTRFLNQLEMKPKLLPFSLKHKLKEGAFAMEDKMLVRLQEDFSMKTGELSLVGKHNIANCLAAGLVAKLLGIEDEDLRCALMDFQAVEHRLECFEVVEEVRFINDSKATNVNATYYALESMTAPTVWIAGGVDKGNDYTEIENLVNEKVKAIICLGVDNTKLINFFRDKKELIYDTSRLEDAVKIAKSMAQAGDCVLLSPCCASFDLFENYEDRGRQFKELVRKLKK